VSSRSAIMIAVLTIGTTTATAATGAAENVALVNGFRVAFPLGGILGLVASALL
jgi:hypothetical protein